MIKIRKIFKPIPIIIILLLLMVILLKTCWVDKWHYSSWTLDESIANNRFIATYSPDSFSIKANDTVFNFNQIWLEHPWVSETYIIGEKRRYVDKHIFVMIFAMTKEESRQYFHFEPENMNIKAPKLPYIQSSNNQLTYAFSDNPPDSIVFLCKDSYANGAKIIDSITVFRKK